MPNVRPESLAERQYKAETNRVHPCRISGGPRIHAQGVREEVRRARTDVGRSSATRGCVPTFHHCVAPGIIASRTIPRTKDLKPTPGKKVRPGGWPSETPQPRPQVGTMMTTRTERPQIVERVASVFQKYQRPLMWVFRRGFESPPGFTILAVYGLFTSIPKNEAGDPRTRRPGDRCSVDHRGPRLERTARR